MNSEMVERLLSPDKVDRWPPKVVLLRTGGGWKSSSPSSSVCPASAGLLFRAGSSSKNIMGATSWTGLADFAPRLMLRRREDVEATDLLSLFAGVSEPDWVAGSAASAASPSSLFSEGATVDADAIASDAAWSRVEGRIGVG